MTKPRTADRQPVQHLALRPKDAACALGIGERLLWQKANRGEIPHVRIGRAVLYPVHLLEDWLATQAKMEKSQKTLPAPAATGRAEREKIDD
ncbi:MAG: helix-turn-helix domain-containing protein [Planctomycetota bacterium]|jgi:hypothetical protein